MISICYYKVLLSRIVKDVEAIFLDGNFNDRAKSAILHIYVGTGLYLLQIFLSEQFFCHLKKNPYGPRRTKTQKEISPIKSQSLCMAERGSSILSRLQAHVLNGLGSWQGFRI